MERLRTLVEQQQAQLAKLNAANSSGSEVVTPAAGGSSTAAAQPASPEPAAPAPAQEADSGDVVKPLRIGGFANWAAGKTNNINDYSLSSQHAVYDNLDTGLIVSLGITPNITAVTQFSIQAAHDHAETDVDFAFLNWKVNDRLSFRIGQNKNPYGLYSEYQGIGTQFPFNDTPNSIYGGTGIGNEFYRGLGVTGRAFSTKNWEVGYDFFAGSRLNDELSPAEQISDAFLNGQTTTDIEESSEEIRQTFGGRITLSRPESGFRLSINGNSGISPDKGRNTIFGGSASYDTAKWLLRSEYGYVFEAGFVHKAAAFFEGGYKVTDHWQPVFRYEWARMGLNAPTAALVPDRFKSHREVGVGLNYWINPRAVVKFSYHNIDGNMLSLPLGTIDLTNLAVIPKNTNAVTLGMGFVF
jgi:hypothetical protein